MDDFAIRVFLGTPDGSAEYYADGFLANCGMAPPRDPATAERIEILKGPAGGLTAPHQLWPILRLNSDTGRDGSGFARKRAKDTRSA